MAFGLTPIFALESAKSLRYFPTARIGSLVRPYHIEVRLLSMKTAVVKLCSCEHFSTLLTLILLQPPPKLPKNPSPTNCVQFKKLNKLNDVETPIWLMIRYLPSIYINQNSVLLRIRTSHPFSLLFRVQLVAVDTKIEEIGRIVDKLVELVHEDLGLQTVSRILEVVQVLQ
jgi:hypothetical protein